MCIQCMYANACTCMSYIHICPYLHTAADVPALKGCVVISAGRWHGLAKGVFSNYNSSDVFFLKCHWATTGNNSEDRFFRRGRICRLVPASYPVGLPERFGYPIVHVSNHSCVFVFLFFYFHFLFYLIPIQFNSNSIRFDSIPIRY